jgi:hypothetical protein
MMLKAGNSRIIAHIEPGKSTLPDSCLAPPPWKSVGRRISPGLLSAYQFPQLKTLHTFFLPRVDTCLEKI